MNSQKSLSSSALKNIAYITMIIDHLGALIIPDILYLNGLNDEDHPLIFLCRFIGRISMPLFVFMITEGMVHTRNVGKYILRLLILAVISEVPFDLARILGPWDPTYQNVMFSLLFAVCLLWVCDRIKEKIRNNKVRILLTVLITLATTTAGALLCTDYGPAIPIIALCFYYFRNRKEIMFPLAFVLILGTGFLNDIIMFLYPVYMPEQLTSNAIIYLFEFTSPAVLALPIIACYNGRKGKQLPKIVYYMIYPGHLLLFYLAAMIYLGRLFH